MYTTAKLHPQTTDPVKSAKRIYLNHKEKNTIIPTTTIQLAPTLEPVEAAIYYTNVPLDGKSDRDIQTAHDLTQQIATTLFAHEAIENISITTKVREKDQAILSTIQFNQNYVEDDDMPAKEKAIWHPLKMETLKTLLSHPEVGPYVPVNDKQLEQLRTHLGMPDATSV